MIKKRFPDKFETEEGYLDLPRLYSVIYSFTNSFGDSESSLMANEAPEFDLGEALNLLKDLLASLNEVEKELIKLEEEDSLNTTNLSLVTQRMILNFYEGIYKIEDAIDLKIQQFNQGDEVYGGFLYVEENNNFFEPIILLFTIDESKVEFTDYFLDIQSYSSEKKYEGASKYEGLIMLGGFSPFLTAGELETNEENMSESLYLILLNETDKGFELVKEYNWELP